MPLKKKKLTNEWEVIIHNAQKLKESHDPKKKALGERIVKQVNDPRYQGKERAFFHYAAILANYEPDQR